MNRVCRVSMIAWLFVDLSAAADSVTFIPVEDATISERYAGDEHGGLSTVDSGSDGPEGGGLNNRALIKFDLSSSIPSNAIVTSAALTLTMVTSPSSTNLWFSLHRVLQGWGETAVTWTNRVSPPAPWSTPGGGAPLDFSSLVSQSNLILGGTVPVAFTFASDASLVADVQDWLGMPASNFGWMLICESEGLEKSKRKFASSESATTNHRPSLEVRFTIPSTPLTLTVLPSTNNQFQFQFSAESNRTYAVVYAGEIETTNWTVLTNFAPLPSPAIVLVSDPLRTDGSRFYRVQSP